MRVHALDMRWGRAVGGERKDTPLAFTTAHRPAAQSNTQGFASMLLVALAVPQRD